MIYEENPINTFKQLLFLFLYTNKTTKNGKYMVA